MLYLKALVPKVKILTIDGAPTSIINAKWTLRN